MQLSVLKGNVRAGVCVLVIFAALPVAPAAAPAGPVTSVVADKRPIPRTCLPIARTDDLFLSRRAEIRKRKQDGPIDLLFLGDSITQRWDPPLWREHFGSWNPANLGIDGDRTQHLLWRVTDGKELNGLSPKVVVLLLGVNNVSYDPAANIAAGIEAILGVVRKRLPKAKVLLLGVFPVGGQPNLFRDRLRLVNLTIASLADGGRVRFLDFGHRFVGPDGTISRKIMPDALHLSHAGYALFAEVIAPVLRDMLE